MKYKFTLGALVPVAAVLLIGLSRFHGSRGVLAASLVGVSLLLHEVAHIIAARLTHTPVFAAGFCLKGPYIRRQAALRSGDEFCIASAGVVTNFCILAAFWNASEMLHWVAGINLYFALCNLLPFGGSDGQRILDVVRGAAGNGVAVASSAGEQARSGPKS